MQQFSNTDRLNPEDARQILNTIVAYMGRQAIDFQDSINKSDNESYQAAYYGDSWKCIYGIVEGVRLMYEGKSEEYDWDQGAKMDHGIQGDGSWQEHYDQYGYGAYGNGLEIGKRLAFYKDRDFTITEDVSHNNRTFDIRSR